ncbi:hypothetical protein [Mycobacterium sp. IDR2000157661]|uniref:hypothetical protein n=1 Tax=Mycobacterium sp. IDR2000157661 TaxID=2867005 RepID=UPI001EEBDB92|nr:hypothetical protein [Mycobacterium sp. IDR2000157661]ULE32362.1 hypothetical protein K3G64_19865 [Mycobacterium sp. IDR2000157661]
MDLREAGHLRDIDEGRVYGRPYEVADGTTIIPVVKPVGLFVVKDGRAQWQPAVDATRIAMLGISVGLVSVALAGLAMVRRPPWPDLYGEVSRRPPVSVITRRRRPGP